MNAISQSVRETSKAPARILIVDDEPMVGELLQDLIRIFGHEPDYCPSPHVALEKAGRENFDLVLLDCRMPAMSGEEFFNALADSRPDLAGRVVFLTGDAHRSETKIFLHSTGSMHLAKPFRFETIKGVIDAALEKAAAGLPVSAEEVAACP
jgi:DNA-binding response OmpR family regulator